MRAIVLEAHGDIDSLPLRLEENFPEPQVKQGDVLIKVCATSLNHHDIFTCRGMEGIKLSFPVIIGCDVAGEIIALGEGVDHWKIGDRVLVDPIDREFFKVIGETRAGGLAEKLVARASQLVPIPDNVSYEQAACIPMAYATAHRMMISRGNVLAGETVLILGASGGVGTACVQLAKLKGATVTACAGTDEKIQKLKELGADQVINYRNEDFSKKILEQYGKPRVVGGGGGVDVIVNYTGGDSWKPSQKCLALGGRILVCGATTGYEANLDMRYLWSFEQTIIGSNAWRMEDIRSVLDLISQNTFVPLIGKTFKIWEAAEALKLLESRNVMGKIVLTP